MFVTTCSVVVTWNLVMHETSMIPDPMLLQALQCTLFWNWVNDWDYFLCSTYAVVLSVWLLLLTFSCLLLLPQPPFFFFLLTFLHHCISFLFFLQGVVDRGDKIHEAYKQSEHLKETAVRYTDLTRRMLEKQKHWSHRWTLHWPHAHQRHWYHWYA